MINTKFHFVKQSENVCLQGEGWQETTASFLLLLSEGGTNMQRVSDPNPNPNPNQCPKSYPNRIPNPNPTEEKIFFPV